MTPGLEGGFLTTGPLGKSLHTCFYSWIIFYYIDISRFYLFIYWTTFWLLWIMLLWTLVYKSLSPCFHSFRLYLGAWLGLPRCASGKELGQEDPLEEEMATHSSILAWRTPWTEKPSGLQSTGLQRVRVSTHTGAGSYDNSVFNFLRNHQIILHSSCTILHCYQQCISVLIFQNPCQHLLFSFLFDYSHFNGCEVDISLCLWCAFP